jgi:hypothetical protein
LRAGFTTKSNRSAPDNQIWNVRIDRAPSQGSYRTRTPQPFDSKCTSSFNTHAECSAFANGVEAVLNHVLKAKDLESGQTARNHRGAESAGTHRQSVEVLLGLCYQAV